MEKIEPKILPGFMELLPADQVLFNQIKDSSIIWCLKFLNNVHII